MSQPTHHTSQDNMEALGEVLLQESFTVWDPKQLIKKGRDRRLFLFDMCLLVCKEVKDNAGKSKYLYKFKLMVGAVRAYGVVVMEVLCLMLVGCGFVEKMYVFFRGILLYTIFFSNC